jgi:predicted acetyltransferase
VKNSWADGFPSGTVEVLEALSSSVEGMREIWRYLCGLDLMSRVRGHFLPVDHPLLHMLAQPDRLRYRLGAGLWVRVIDVESALAGRRYDRDGVFVFRLTDRACPWNEATWRMSVEDGRAHLERTDDEPDLGMSAVELGAIYLGGMGVYELERAGRIQELSRGASALADGIFRWPIAPWCPEIF